MSKHAADPNAPIDPPLSSAVDRAVEQATKRLHRRWVVVMATLMLLAVPSLLYLGHRGQAAEEGQAAGEDLAGQVLAVCRAGGAEAAKLRAQGSCEKAGQIEQPASKPDATTTVIAPPSTVTASAPRGVSEADVRRLVAAALTQAQVKLTAAQTQTLVNGVLARIRQPADGRTPTQDELQALAQAAVATFCAEDRCQGKKGDKGDDAPAITDEQFQTQFAAYCAAHNDCRGDKGEAGRGITSGPTCIGTGSESYWLTRYSDDTEQRQQGPCRLDPPITTPPVTDPPNTADPTPTETPKSPTRQR
jgi:hypothetical protein